MKILKARKRRTKKLILKQNLSINFVTCNIENIPKKKRKKKRKEKKRKENEISQMNKEFIKKRFRTQ